MEKSPLNNAIDEYMLEKQGSEIALLKALGHSSLICAMMGEGDIMSQEDGAKFSFVMIKSPQDELFYPAFSDMSRYEKWELECEASAVTLRFDELANILKNSDAAGIVINPFDQCLVLGRDFLKLLK